ncbi:hypothetical protein ABPG72_021798 [Tetrahymena utriculariae]
MTIKQEEIETQSIQKFHARIKKQYVLNQLTVNLFLITLAIFSYFQLQNNILGSLIILNSIILSYMKHQKEGSQGNQENLKQVTCLLSDNQKNESYLKNLIQNVQVLDFSLVFVISTIYISTFEVILHISQSNYKLIIVISMFIQVLIRIELKNMQNTRLKFCFLLLIQIYTLIRLQIANNFDIFSTFVSILLFFQQFQTKSISQTQNQELKHEIIIDKDETNIITTLYDSILQIIPEGIAVLNSDKQILYSNTTLKKILQCSSQKALQQVLLNLGENNTNKCQEFQQQSRTKEQSTNLVKSNYMKDIAQKKKTQEAQKVFVPNYTSQREIQKSKEEQRKYAQSTKNLSFSSIKPKNKNIFEKYQSEQIQKSLSISKNKPAGEIFKNSSQEAEAKQQTSCLALKIELLQDQLKEKKIKNNYQSFPSNSSKNFQDSSVQNIEYKLHQGSVIQEQNTQIKSQNSNIQTQFQKQNRDHSRSTYQIKEQISDNSCEEGIRLNIQSFQKIFFTILGELSQYDANNKQFDDQSKIEESNQDKQENALKRLYSIQNSCLDIKGLEKILKKQTKISEKTINSQNGYQFDNQDLNNTENKKTNEPLLNNQGEIQKDNQNKVPFQFKINAKNQVNNRIMKEKINFSALIDKMFEKSSSSKIEKQREKESQEEKRIQEEQVFHNKNSIEESLNYIQKTENMTQILVKYKNKDLVVQLLSIDVLLSDSNKRDTLVFVIIQDLWQDLYLKKVEDIQKDKLKLFATLSHELRTPLNCSISMLEVLKEELSQQQNNKFCIEEYINPALFSNKLLLNQINDILDYVQMDCGKFKYSFFGFNIVNLLKDCAKLVSIQAKMKNVQLLVAFDQKINQEICSDPNRIRQIILNFLSNSLKFTKSGGFIELGYQQITKDIYKFYVKDSGIGITKENQQKIFGFCNKINYQNKEEEQLNYQGCGLGLTISNQLAEGLITEGNFKGGISVQSEYGVGSIFSILVEDLNHFYQNIDQTKLNSLKQINQRKSIKSSQNRIDCQRNSIKNSQYLKIHSNISQINEQNAEQSVVSTNGNDELNDSQIEELNKSLHHFIQENYQFEFDKNQKCIGNNNVGNLKEANQDNLKSKFQENVSNLSSSQIIDDATNQDLRVNINRPFYIQQNRNFQEEEKCDLKNNQIQSCIALKLQPCSIPFKSQNSKFPQKNFDQSNNNRFEQSVLQKNSLKQITSQSSNQDLQYQINKKCSSLIQENIQQQNENTQISNENMVESDLKKNGSEISYLNKKTSTQGSLQNWSQRKSISIFKQKQESKEENIQNEQEGFISYAVSKQIEGSRLSTSKITSSSLINEKQSKMICFFKSSLSYNKSVIEVDNTIDINKNEILIPTSQQFIEEILEFNINKKKKCQCPQIMVVDDNQFNLYALQKIIQQFQFNLISLSDGDQAIEAIKNQYFSDCCPSPHMILMDIEMPNKNGYETVKEIIEFYKTFQYKNIPVIVACTAYVGQEDYEKSIDSGMDDFINKPILKMAFQNLIQNYRYQFFNRN